MDEHDIIKSTKVYVSVSGEDVSKNVSGILSGCGFQDVTVVENTLELVLAASKEKSVCIVSDTTGDVLEIGSALDHIEKNDPYATICVIADSWSDEKYQDLTQQVDVFVTAPVTEKNLLPGMTLDIARKRHLRELEEELGSSETSFAKEKNFGFAKQLIMDKLGLSEESAGDYLLSVGGKYGYDGSDVAEIIYDVLLAGDKEQ